MPGDSSLSFSTAVNFLQQFGYLFLQFCGTVEILFIRFFRGFRFSLITVSTETGRRFAVSQNPSMMYVE